MGCREVLDSLVTIRMRFLFIVFGATRGPYCEVVETKQSHGQGAQVGAPEADRKPLNAHACFLSKPFFLRLSRDGWNKLSFQDPRVWFSGVLAFVLPKDWILSQSMARMEGPSHPFV